MLWFHDTNMCDYELMVREDFFFLFSFFVPFYSVSTQGQIRQACFYRDWICLFLVCFLNSFIEHVILLGYFFIWRILSWYSFFRGPVYPFSWYVILLLTHMCGLCRLTDDFHPDVNFITTLSLFNHTFSFFWLLFPLQYCSFRHDLIYVY